MLLNLFNKALNVSGRIFLEAGISAGQTRCTVLHFPNDSYVNTLVQEFELELVPFGFAPGFPFVENVHAWLFLVEPSGKHCICRYSIMPRHYNILCIGKQCVYL